MVQPKYNPQESLQKIQLMMRYDSSKTLNENRGLMNAIPALSESVVITDWLSPDDKYLILLDELYDLEAKVKLGDIWENFDNFKLFMSHSFEVAKNIPTHIKESISETLNSLILTESKNNISNLKPLLRQFLNEQGFFSDVKSGLKKTGQWFADQATDFGYDLKDLVTTGFDGVKKVVNGITQGDWKQVLNLLGQGMLFFARKLRSLLYNPVGIILDAILVATGIGKGVQWIPWAIIVALDIYEVSTGDYEQKDVPTWLRWIMIGCDFLGLIFTADVAGAAKAALSVFKGAKTTEEFAQIAARNPNTVKWLEKIIGTFSKIPEYLGKAATYLKSTKLAKASPWIEGILGKAEGVLAQGSNSLNEIVNTAKSASKGGEAIRATQAGQKTVSQLASKGAKEGLKTAAVVAGVDKGLKKGMQLYQGLSDEEMEQQEMMARTMKNFEREKGISLNDYIKSLTTNQK
jgi:hypothetical protein